MPRRHIALPVKAEALRLAAQGRSSRKIARVLGIDKATITRWLVGTPLQGLAPRGNAVNAVPPPCRHLRTIVSGRPRVQACQECGAHIPDPPPVRPSPVPEWVKEPTHVREQFPTIPSPSWGHE